MSTFSVRGLSRLRAHAEYVCDAVMERERLLELQTPAVRARLKNVRMSPGCFLP